LQNETILWNESIIVVVHCIAVSRQESNGFFAFHTSFVTIGELVDPAY
jgi:hypothetical protein